MDAVVYAAFRVAWALLRAVPLGALRAGLEAIGRTAWLVDRRHRDVVSQNLATAFPEWGAEKRRAVERQAFANWGRIAAELLHFEKLAATSSSQSVVGKLEPLAEQLLARERGLLVLTAHTGNFELLARLWGSATGQQIAVFHRMLRNRLIDGFLSRERGACSFRVVGRGGAVREALRILAANGVFVVPLDQNQLPGRGIFVNLFGRSACTSTLLARLALATGAPVLPVFAAWKGEETVAVVGELIETPEGGSKLRGDSREATLRDLTSRYTSEIERMVRAYPEQWNWAHRRWKTRPEAEVV